MKFNMSIKELVEFIEGATDSDEIKKTLAGAFVAISKDPIVMEALQKKVDQFVDLRIVDALDHALKRDYRGEINGWAAEILKKTVIPEIQKMNVQQVLKTVVQEELANIRADRNEIVKDVTNIVEDVVVRMLPKYASEEYTRTVANRYDINNIKKTVRDEVNTYMKKVFGSMEG